MGEKVTLTFSNGKEEMQKSFSKRNPFPFLRFMQKLPDGFKLIKAEGNGELAKFFQEQIELSKQQGKEYQPDFNKLITLFVGGKAE